MAGLGILVGPAEDEDEEMEASEEEHKKPDQDAIINEIRTLLDKLQPAVSQFG